MLKEAYDDINRYRRDKELNNTPCRRLTKAGFVTVPAASLSVGDIVQLTAKDRVPADMLLLRTTSVNGAAFIKTDQLELRSTQKIIFAVMNINAL